MTLSPVNGQSRDESCEMSFWSKEGSEPDRGPHEHTPGAAESDVEIVDWDGPLDPGNPVNWTRHRKWLVAGMAILAPLICCINGTSITVAASEINQEFNVSDETFPNSYWPVFSWTLGGALFVPIFLPLMEDLGVRRVFFIFYVLFFAMIFGQAFAPNFAALVVTRFFSGGSTAVLSNTISSMIPNLWDHDYDRSAPVGLYILFYLVGSTVGPPMFGGVVQYVGDWRWIFYIQLIIVGSFLPLYYFLVKETRGDIILAARAKRIRKETGRRAYATSELNQTNRSARLIKSMTRPAYLLFTEPVLFSATLWSAFSFGLVFLFTQSVTRVYMSLYDWPEYSTGYVLGAVVIGEILGWSLTFYGSHLYFKSAPRNTEMPGHPIPEARLYVSIPASFVGIVGGMLVYAWTSYENIHWMAPTIGLALVGFGIQVVISSVADYVTDLYSASSFAGSAISAVAAVENIFAGTLPLAEKSMYTDLGFQWASTLLAFLSLLLTMAPVVFVWKGRQLRARSPFMLAGEQVKA